jgi:hypothetical protein
MRPNEAFSGRNRARHLCRECTRRPKHERDRAHKLRALRAMLHRQSNISDGNIKTATTWANDPEAEVATLARLTADIGRIHPRKKKRFRHIRREDPALFQRMIAAGVAIDRWDDPEPREAPVDLREALASADHSYVDPLDEDDIPF